MARSCKQSAEVRQESGARRWRGTPGGSAPEGRCCEDPEDRLGLGQQEGGQSEERQGFSTTCREQGTVTDVQCAPRSPGDGGLPSALPRGCCREQNPPRPDLSGTTAQQGDAPYRGWGGVARITQGNRKSSKCTASYNGIVTVQHHLSPQQLRPLTAGHPPLRCGAGLCADIGPGRSNENTHRGEVTLLTHGYGPALVVAQASLGGNTQQRPLGRCLCVRYGEDPHTRGPQQ